MQDLEDDLYDSKERIQRLRRQNDQLTAENEHLRGVVEKFDSWLRLSARNTATSAVKNAYLDAQYILTELLERNYRMSTDFIKTMNAAWARGRVQQADLKVFANHGAKVTRSLYISAGLGDLTMDYLLRFWKKAALNPQDAEAA